MNVIGLMIARNESWVLPTTLPQLNRFVDGLIVLDGHSEDATADLVQQAGGVVIPQKGTKADYSAWRQTLLEEGRRRKGTHFVWLDADEAFTTNFLANHSKWLNQMKPGQKLLLDSLCLWKDPYQVVVGDSVWARIPKDFIFCDDAVSEFGTTLLHEGRTPGANLDTKLVSVPRAEGAVLHFQFVPFARFQMKQAYQRCREWVLRHAKSWDINARYAITLDDPNIVCSPIPENWLKGLEGLDTLATQGPGWFYSAILKYFEEHGVAHFEPLQIWHVPELLEVFRKETGRQPSPMLQPPFPVRLKRSLVQRARKHISKMKF